MESSHFYSFYRSFSLSRAHKHISWLFFCKFTSGLSSSREQKDWLWTLSFDSLSISPHFWPETLSSYVATIFQFVRQIKYEAETWQNFVSMKMRNVKIFNRALMAFETLFFDIFRLIDELSSIIHCFRYFFHLITLEQWINNTLKLTKFPTKY